jgi:mannosyltransferase OCH1-like enzyme
MSIPKIVHQIWIGDNEKPDAWMKTIRDFCRDYKYQYKLWDEESIKSLCFDDTPGLERVYKETTRLSGKCNILRLLILKKYGGIYIDADCVVLHPEKFNKFIKKNNGKTFLSWESLDKSHFKAFSKNTRKNSDMYGRKKIIANSIIGSKKEHPFINVLLDNIPAYYNEHAGKGTWRETGPGYTVNMYDIFNNDIDDLCIYPMNVFYPKGWIGPMKGDEHLKYMKSKSLFFQYGYSTNNFSKKKTLKIKR